MPILKKTIEYLFYFFLFLLPWQTVWIFQERFLNGAKWEYGTMVVYGSEILLWAIIFLQLILWLYEKKFLIFNFQFLNNFQFSIFNFQTKKLLVTSYWLLVTFIIWSGLSIIWSADRELAFYWWFKMLEGILFFFLILNLKFDWRKFNWSLVLSGAVQSVLAIWQFLTQEIVANKWLGIAQYLPSQLGTVVIEVDGSRWLRAYGAFNHPNILGGFLVICFFLCLFLYFKYKKNVETQIFASLQIIFLIIIFVGLFFSFSRSAWLALVVAYSIWLIADDFSKEKRLDIFKSAAYLILTFVILFSLYQPLVMTRLSGNERLEIKSTEQRIDSLKEAKEIIKTNWLLGVGIGNYTFELYKQNPDLPAWAYQPVHNLYLLIWSELGLIGLFAYLLISLFAYQLIIKNNLIGLSLSAALLTIGLFDHYFWTSYIGIIMWWLVLGMVIKMFNFSKKLPS